MTSMKSHHRPWVVRENLPSPASSQGPCESSWPPGDQDACRTPGITEPKRHGTEDGQQELLVHRDVLLELQSGQSCVTARLPPHSCLHWGSL